MRFKRIRTIADILSKEISKFNEPELKRLIGECQRLSQTNCGWMMYGLKEIVTEIAKCRIRWFKINRKKLKK